MLVEKITVNVGENPIYVELHDADKTPVHELKYGDCRYNDKREPEIWYGEDNSGLNGWVVTPWAQKNVTGVILAGVHSENGNSTKYIYRVMNNDIDFDEAAYTAIEVGGDNE